MAKKQDAVVEIDPLQVLESLTLEQIDTQISEVDAKIDEAGEVYKLAIEPHKKRRDGLLQLRKFVDFKLNGKPQRATRKPKAVKEGLPVVKGGRQPGPETQAAVGRIQAFLASSGPTRPAAIAHGIGLEPPANIYRILDANSQRFEKLPSGEYRNK